jgi:uncharacterized metal-binding protein YceD (DUF177 family)
MSTFNLDLEEFEGETEPLQLELEPSNDELLDLFEPIEEDFELTHPDGVAIDLMAGLDGETVWLSGSIEGTFSYTCGRCLEERDIHVHGLVDITVLPKDEWAEAYEGEEELGLDEDDLDTAHYEGHAVDLRPHLLDAVVMELPAWPQCPDEMREACDEAYEENIGDETLDRMEKHEVDLRWWPLRDIEVEEDGDQEAAQPEDEASTDRN